MLADEFIKKEMQDCINRIAARLDATGTTASGKTRDSLHLEAQERVYTIFGRDYFSTVETGRKAGKVPGNMTAIIKEWAIAKKIGLDPIEYTRKPSDKWTPKYTPAERALNAFAGAVAHKIATQGSKLYRDGGRNDIFSQEIRLTIDKLVQGYSTIFSTEVIQTIKLNF